MSQIAEDAEAYRQHMEGLQQHEDEVNGKLGQVVQRL